MKKRALIITYYWPPSGGAGVQRWLKFAKYLPSFGWQPVIYTPENPEMPVVDNSLLKDIPKEAEIIRTRIWEPYSLYKVFTSRKGEQINTGFLNEKGKGGITEKISVWLRGNLFIPDARRFWIKPSVKYLHRYIKKNPVDVIISSGPPHSMHLIAMELKKISGIKWIADFRDPWTNIDFYNDLMLTSYADKKHHALQSEVLKNADAVIAVGETMARDFHSIASRKVHVITNGFDSEDAGSGNVSLSRKFTIAHIGTMVRTRNPEGFWKALSALIERNSEFAADLEIVLIGKVDFSIQSSLQQYQLADYVQRIDYLQHDAVIQMQKSSQVLLLVLNNTPNSKGILTGKLFEYMASGRPVLCIGDTDGDAARIINEAHCGVVCSYTDVKSMEQAVMNYYEAYKQNRLFVTSEGIEKFSRKALTGELVKLINE